MASEWNEVTVSEIASPDRNALVGGPFGSNLVSKDYVGEGVPVIRGHNMGERWISSEFVYVTPEKAESLTANLARPWDIIFTQRGTLGQVALVPEKPFERYLVSQSQMKLTVDRAKADPLFYYYVFQSPEQQAYIHRNTIQTGVPHTNLGILRNAPVPFPPLPEQRAIAAILGALDDKIELNRRMSRTLEAMARALSKQWFVDGAEEGWAVKPLDEVANYLNGLALQKFPPKDGEESLPVIKISQLRKNSTEGADRASADIDPAYIVNDGDVLFSWSGSLEVSLWCGGKGALNQHLFKVTSKQYPKWFYYLWTREHLPDFQEIAAGKATTMGHIQRHHLKAAIAIVPPEPIMKRMTAQMSPLIDRYILNALQSRTLAALRDALLPKLMSGEICVKGVESALTEHL